MTDSLQRIVAEIRDAQTVAFASDEPRVNDLGRAYKDLADRLERLSAAEQKVTEEPVLRQFRIFGVDGTPRCEWTNLLPHDEYEWMLKDHAFKVRELFTRAACESQKSDVGGDGV